MCHLVKRHQALNAGKGELRRAKCGRHADRVAVLAWHFDKAAHGIAYKTKQIAQCDRASVECLLGRAAQHLD